MLNFSTSILFGCFGFGIKIEDWCPIHVEFTPFIHLPSLEPINSGAILYDCGRIRFEVKLSLFESSIEIVIIIIFFKPNVAIWHFKFDPKNISALLSRCQICSHNLKNKTQNYFLYLQKATYMNSTLIILLSFFGRVLFFYSIFFVNYWFISSRQIEKVKNLTFIKILLEISKIKRKKKP